MNEETMMQDKKYDGALQAKKQSKMEEQLNLTHKEAVVLYERLSELSTRLQPVLYPENTTVEGGLLGGQERVEESPHIMAIHDIQRTLRNCTQWVNGIIERLEV